MAQAVLFRNANVFDGVGPGLLEATDVLIEGDSIRAVSPVPLEVGEGVRVIDGTGRTLMPGLIDLHTHPSINLPLRQAANASPVLVGASLARTLEMYLRQGFTTIRETGGACSGEIARALDQGLVTGPRLFPSGRFLSQTSGHGDHRPENAPNPGLEGCCGGVASNVIAYLVDSPHEVRKAARENLRGGASQIKIMAGGGVASAADPIHSVQFRPEEIRAAVEVAEDWGTYVTAHLYHDRSALRCLDNGVRCLEHGHLLTEDVVARCGREGVPLITQAVTYVVMSEVAPAMGLARTSIAKNGEILQSLGNVFRLIGEHGVKTGFSTDLIAGQQHQVNREFALRTPYFSNLEILRQATSESAEILAMCGPLNRYGHLGQVREGWLADLILVDGDPLENVAPLVDHDAGILLVMKGGQVFKDLVANR